MYIYILLIVSIVSISVLTKILIKNKEKQEKVILICGMFLIFLLLALKKETVGADITGYKLQYEISRKIPWDIWNYVYFENGYIALQKLFSKAGVSFQLFTVFLYGFFCLAMYRFIEKYSKNNTLSLLILICYQFLVFSISGLRQTVAMAVCIWAFIICEEKKKKILSILLILCAMQIHASAVVFLAVIPILLTKRKDVNIPVWSGVIVFSILFREQIWSLMKLFYEIDSAEPVWGGNLFFLLGITVFAAFTYSFAVRGKKSIDSFAVRITMLALVAYFVLCGSTLLRASMYFTMFFIWVLPEFTAKYRGRERFMLNTAIGAFLIVLFYVETLAVNQLHLCPYLFFWQ